MKKKHVVIALLQELYRSEWTSWPTMWVKSQRMNLENVYSNLVYTCLLLFMFIIKIYLQ
jgi:hypothetical protein